MPDFWELANGLDPNDPEDSNLIDGNGYTALENYLNSLVGEYVNSKVKELNSVPSEFYVNQNYPNPFNTSTTIQFVLPKGGNLSINIYDLRGRLVKDIYDGYCSRGNYSKIWNGNNYGSEAVSTGIYFCQFELNGSQKKVIKMHLIR
jgi:flagellar hook assembly protein FlgD